MSIYRITNTKKVSLENAELFKNYLNTTYEKFIAVKEKEANEGKISENSFKIIYETCKAQLSSCLKIIERTVTERNFDVDKDFITSIEFTDFENDLSEIVVLKKKKQKNNA